ncbi:MAG: hypothetical protein ACHQET_10960, partial [Chitinophagales bacterium]
MKKCFLLYLIIVMSSISLPVFAQNEKDTASLGLPGDNLDLYAVLDLFLKSKTIEGFEKSLNEEKAGINNLDLNLDKKIDFIKVITKKENDAYTFILQVSLSKTDSQDVAVILVNRDKDKKVSVQIVGDEELYGKDYVIEPRTKPTPSVTANPAYEGKDPVTQDVPASTTTVVVQSAPIVQYVYSPAYVPYYPPYYYGFYPPYFAMATTIAVGIYRANHYYYHGGYYGGHYGGGNTVVINNRNQINHYNNSNRTRSNTVSDNMARGNYGNRGSGSGSNRPGGASGGNRPSTMPSNRPAGGAGGGNHASTMPSNRASNGPSASTRQSSSNFSSSNNRSSSGGGSRSGGGGFSGGGRGG